MKRIILTVSALGMFAMAQRLEAQEFQVVVNASASLTQISRDDLSNIFQKKKNNLPSGESAKPVDLSADADVRESFSQAVHGRSANQIAAYWQQQIFSGRGVPPEEKASEDEVIAYVSSTPGAIGYVSAGASLGSGVKTLAVSD